MAVFSASEIEAIRPLAMAKLPTPQPVDEKRLNRCIASMSHMPHRDSGITGSRLQLAVYIRMLSKYSTEAVNDAVQRCLRELTFFPSVKDLADRCEAYTHPNQYLINRAARIIRTGKRIPKETPPLSQAEIDRMSPDILAFGVASGAIVKTDQGFMPAPERSSGNEKGGV